MTVEEWQPVLYCYKSVFENGVVIEARRGDV